MLIILSLLCGTMVGGLASLALTRSWSPRERALIPSAVALHLGGALAHVWVVENVYGSGDMTMYWEHGGMLASVLGGDPSRFWDVALRLLFQDPDVQTPVLVYGIGTSTGTMTGLAAILALMLPDSIASACVVVSMSALVGKLLIYSALREQLQARAQRTVLAAILFLPSTVFWSAGLLKEAVAMLPLGFVVVGMYSLTRRLSLRALVQLGLGAISIALLKPYILVALSFAGAAWFYAYRTVKLRGRLVIRPIPLALVAVAGLLAATLLGTVFPEYALSNLSDEAARLQEVGTRVDGGSNYSLSPAGSGPLQQLALAPLALLTGLFRPLLFEARNPTMFLAALESLVVLGLSIRALFGARLRAALIQGAGAPMLLFCLTFTLLMAVAVGLASTNLGTLSRYRMPMTPFLISGLAMVLSMGSTARAASVARGKEFAT